MPHSDPLQILLLHDRWATQQVLDACKTLSSDQFLREFDIGPGSLHETLTHICGAMRTWTDTLAGRDLRPWLQDEKVIRTPAALQPVVDDAYDAFAAEAARRPLDDTVTRRLRDGRVFTFTRGAVLTHVTTHGVHHRAQCLNMLRQLGVSPLPRSSVTEWTWTKDV
jgi:uncharacterized damage-inducible protein DinB